MNRDTHTNSGDCRYPCKLCILENDKGCNICGKPHQYQCTRGCHKKICETCAKTILPTNLAYSDKTGWRTYCSRRGHILYACSYQCCINSDLED